MDDNVFYLKLLTGEDIVTKIEDYQDDSSDILIEDPMLIQYFSSQTGYDAGMRPWIPGVIKQNRFPITREHIMLVLPTSDTLTRFYNRMIDTKSNNTFVETAEDEDDDIYDEEAFERRAANTTGPISTRIH